MDDGIKEEYLRSAYRVVFYIEQNYASELTLEELSSVAGFSKYHFHRIFKSVIGESLGDFIRRARLAKTSMKFKTDERITKIAMESGYETSASFAKAFKKHFGITPREFGKSSRVTKGEAMLEAKFVDFDAVEVFYVRKTGAYEKSCCEAWEALMKFAYEQKIKHKKNILGKNSMAFGVGHDNPNMIEAEKLRCDACITRDDKSVEPSGEVFVKTIGGGRYAVFLHKGAYANLKSTYDAIGDWIVSSGSKVRDEPMFERYLNRDPRRTKPENLRTEIYVPVV